MPIYFYAARDQKFLDYKPDSLTAKSLSALFDAPELTLAEIPEDERHGMYYGLAETKEPRRADPTDPETGKKLIGAWARDKWVRQEVLAWDLDGITEADRARVVDYQDVVAGVLGIAPEDMSLVASGHGFHMLVWLRTPITDPTFFKKQRIFYRAILDRIDAELGKRGLSGAGDPAIFDFNRVLRLPGTENRKREPFQLCRLIQHSKARHEIDLRALSGIPPVGEGETVAREVYAHRRLDVKGILEECLVLKSTREDPGSVKEPLGYAALSVLGRLDPDHKIAREYLSQWTSSSSLMSTDQDKKIEQALASSGPRTCKSFENLSPKCLECPWRGKITSPILIESENFVPTEEDGFWRESLVNGKIVHRPAYDDMLKVYRRETHYFLQPETDAIWPWGPTHYSKAFQAEIRNWCERKTRPQLSSTQRGEFLAKLESNHLLSEKQFDAYRERCQGMLNLRNGVLDTRTGVLYPHDPRYGFKYCIDYDYDPQALCPKFDEFLDTVMRGNPDLIAAVWDAIASCLWDGYQGLEASFWVFSGWGSNGKTSLLSILVAVLGGLANCVYLKPKHFKPDERFALSSLEGKLLCIIEEVNESHLGDDFLGMLKDMSDGGTISVEGKRIAHWQMRNTAKVFITTNKSLILQDTTTGIQRRMIVTPCEENFEDPKWEGRKDPDIVAKILPELPGILNRGLQALSRLRAKGGKPLHPSLSRSEMEQMVSNSDSVERWAKDNVEVTNNPDDFICSREAFAAYKNWLGEDSAKTSVTTFSARLRRKTYAEIRGRNPERRTPEGKRQVIWGLRKREDSDATF